MKHSLELFIVAFIATIFLSGQYNLDKTSAQSNKLNKTCFLEHHHRLTIIENKEAKQHFLIDEILQSQESNQLIKSLIMDETSKSIELFAPLLESETKSKPMVTDMIQRTEGKTETSVEKHETPTGSISEEEKELLARLVEAEAKGEPYEGKVAVATIVLNRVESPQFPNTVKEVIHEVVGSAYAFTPVQNGTINQPASVESIEAVEEALKREDTLNDSIFFYNPNIATDQWIRSRQIVKTIGNHVFAI